MPLENTSDSTLSDDSGDTEIKLRPFYHTDIKNTLENIVFTEKQDIGKSILEKLFTDKSKTLKTTNEIEELCKKLKPIIGEKADTLWYL